MQRCFQECWRSAQRWRTLISAGIQRSEQPGRRGLQDRELVHLNLSYNAIEAAGAEILAGVLGQCTALTHLNLSYNLIRVAGAESFAGGLAQCKALAHLDLSYTFFGEAGAERLAGLLAQCQALAHLNLSGNDIDTGGWL